MIGSAAQDTDSAGRAAAFRCNSRREGASDQTCQVRALVSHQACAIGWPLILRSGTRCRCSTRSNLAARCHSDFVRSAARSADHFCLRMATLFGASKGCGGSPFCHRFILRLGGGKPPMCLAARVSMRLSEAAENMRASRPTIPSHCRAIRRASLCKSAHRSGPGSATLSPAVMALRTCQI